jgi:hypothetical protein
MEAKWSPFLFRIFKYKKNKDYETKLSPNNRRITLF